MSDEQFQEFFKSAGGQFLIAAVGFLIFFVIVGNLYKRKQFSVKSLTFMALSISLAVMLSFVPLFDLPYGGSVTLCSMFFITIVGYMFGPVSGILAGVTYAFLRLAIKPEVYTPVQVVLDYLLGFGFLGLSGFFNKNRGDLYIGYAIAVSARFVASFISGILFFGQYAPEGMHVWLYSFLYNGGYIVGELILTFVIISIPPVKAAIEQVKKLAVS